MSELPRPVSEILRPPVGEPAIHDMWRGISERRAAARARRRPVWAAAALAAAALAFVVIWFVPRAVQPTQAGPLRLADGSEIGQLAVAPEASATRSVVLSDGSRLTLSPGATLTQLESSGTRFSALLGTGRVDVEVVPGGPRQWSLECGLATVEVVGTRFSVDRSPARVRVEVAEGIVLVRGERVPERVKRLEAGGVIEILAAPAETASAAAPSAPSDVAPRPEPAASASANEVPAAPQAGAWRELARRGAYADAYRSLGDRGIARETTSSSVEDLLALADVARLSGHPAEAVAPLRRVVQEHAGDARAALAAFTLGRIQLDSLGQAAAAAQSFAQALSMGIAGPLVEDARARLVEAHARAGNRDAAKAAAEQYEKQFPTGRHAAAVRRWVAD